jgi:Anti-sigma factor NepR
MYGEMSKDTPRSKVKQQIDENLKRVYDASLNEDVPDRFKQLLDQLRAQQNSGGDKT